MPNETTAKATPPLERKLATILCADVAGYSDMMGANEEQTVQVFRGHRDIFESLVSLHRGRIFNTAGDALLVEFNSAVEAVRCATEIQAALATRNEHLAPGEKMLFRIGINLGDVIVQGDDLLGDGVNVAARIQTATEAGGIRISGSVYDQIQNKLSLGFKLLGEHTYKNIAKPVRTYSISEGAAVSARARRASTKMPAAIAAGLLLMAGAGYWGYGKYATHQEEQARIQSQLMAQLEAQKQATEETLRRAQQERNQLEQDRRMIENEKRAASASKKQTPTLPISPVVSRGVAQYDGIYNGRLCNQFQERSPVCRRVMLIVRNGVAEGSWTTATNKTSTVKGTVDANGALELTWANWTPADKLLETNLTGRIDDHVITASGRWRNGAVIAGNWKRAQ